MGGVVFTMNNEGLKYTGEREAQVIKLCQDLIRIKSYSGQEGQVVNKLMSTMLDLGFDDVLIDDYGSIIGHIKGMRPGRKLLFDGHLDTVPVPDPAGWSHEPFSGEIDKGKIYGRGASDMKGA
jgi:acetylornithine deacetylase/succinyl-diaminopimelate desuccinylase-like protein